MAVINMHKTNRISQRTNSFEAIANMVIEDYPARRVGDFKTIQALRGSSVGWRSYAEVLLRDTLYYRAEVRNGHNNIVDTSDGFVDFAVHTFNSIHAKYAEIVELKAEKDGAGLKECNFMTVDYSDNIITDDHNIYHKQTAVIAIVAYINFIQNNPEISDFFNDGDPHKPMHTQTKAIYDEFIRIFSLKYGIPDSNI